MKINSNLKITLYISFISILLNSCTKKTDNHIGPTMGKLISTIQYSTGGSYNYTYNSNGQRATFVYKFGTITEIGSYTYTASSITMLANEISGTNQYTIKATILLNNAGLAISEVDSTTGSSTSGNTLYYIYDANGYRTSTITQSSTQNFSYQNGNLSTTIYSGTTPNNYSYTYLMDKPNTLGNQNVGIYYLGKDNANLKNSYTYTSGTSTTTYNYSYIFNSDGTVQKLTITMVPSTGTPSTSWIAYTYQ